MVFSKKLVLIIISAILIFSAFIRIYQISDIPSGFHADEAAFGYNAYSILQTGKDEYGEFLPTVFRSFDDYKPGLYFYYSVPFVYLFGLSEFSVRFPTAIIGILFVLVSFLITLKLTKKESLALLTAGLVSISPILIFISRVQSDPLFAVFLVMLGIYFFLIWIEKKKKLFFLASFIFFILSITAYQSPKVFLPVFLPFLALIYFKNLKHKEIFVLILSYLALIFFIVIYSISGTARAGQTSVFSKPEVQLILEESIREEGNRTPIIVARIFNNKPHYYARALIENYFNYISFDFLFFQGEMPTRERVVNFGFLYLVDLPFLLIGLVQVFKKRYKWGYLAVGWILITPLVLAPFVEETPNLHRFLFAIFPLILLTAFGILELLKYTKRKKYLYIATSFFIIFIYAFSFIYFIHQLFIIQPVHRPWYRNYAYKELINSINVLEPKYKKVYISTSDSNVYIFYLFYNKFDPKLYQESGSRGNERYGKLGKFNFYNDACLLDAGKEGKDKITKGEIGALYISNGGCVVPENDIKYIKTINWADGNPAFRIMEYKPGYRNTFQNK